MPEYVIRYRYPGVIYHGDEEVDVGLVYAQQSDWDPNVWSYTYDPADATHFPFDYAAEAIAVDKYWPEWVVVDLASAEHLRPRRGPMARAKTHTQLVRPPTDSGPRCLARTHKPTRTAAETDQDVFVTCLPLGCLGP